ncbi:MAG TPA: hypothetical protein VGI96_27800 [Streptosporangiaceae bacterium]|jgi:hypothetical protein
MTLTIPAIPHPQPRQPRRQPEENAGGQGTFRMTGRSLPRTRALCTTMGTGRMAAMTKVMAIAVRKPPANATAQ